MPQLADPRAVPVWPVHFREPRQERPAAPPERLAPDHDHQALSHRTRDERSGPRCDPAIAGTALSERWQRHEQRKTTRKKRLHKFHLSSCRQQILSGSVESELLTDDPRI